MIRRLLLLLAAAAAPGARAGDHLIYERYRDTLDINAQGRVVMKTVKRIRVADAEGVPLLTGEMSVNFDQKSSQHRGYKCERWDAAMQSDRFFRWELRKVNVSSSGVVTDEVIERPSFTRVMAGDTMECEMEVAYDSIAYVRRIFIDDPYPVRSRVIEINVADPALLSYRLLNETAAPQIAGSRLSWSLGPLAAWPQRLRGQYAAVYARQLLLNYGVFNFFGKSYPAGSWADIAAWNSAVTAPARPLGESLAAQARALAAGAKSDREKASRLFDWVRDTHRYVAVELGAGGWVPRTPDEVDRNKYGDCKDFANLFTAMAREAGLKTATLRVNTRSNGPVLADFPSPLNFNHQMGAVWLDGQWVYADATHKFLELGWLREDVEGTRAMLIPDPGAAELVTLPYSGADDNHTIWTLAAANQGDFTEIKGTHLRHGAGAGDFREEMERAGSSMELSAKMQRWLAGQLPGARDLAVAGNYHNVHKPIELMISASAPGMLQVDGGRRYLRLFPLQFERDAPSGSPEPTSPIYLGRQSSTLIDINWKLERPGLIHLPEPLNFRTPFGYLYLTAERTPDGLRVYREFAVTRNEIAPAEFPAYKEFILKAQELHNQYYDLGPADGPPPAAEKPAASPAVKPKAAPAKPRKPAAKKPA
jgi:transglutaminase-like putative cysteine protease